MSVYVRIAKALEVGAGTVGFDRSMAWWLRLHSFSLESKS
jgi:hypothetical protein